MISRFRLFSIERQMEGLVTWNDTVVNSWSELIWHLHSPELVPLRVDEGGHYRSPYVFRGQCVAEWPLKTSLQRLGTQPHIVERPILRNFKKYSPPNIFKSEDDWDLISVAQHNGLPTRVLDWSASPLVAAHFATDNLSHKYNDGVIWCVDAAVMRGNLPYSLLNHVKGESAWVFDIEMLKGIFCDLNEFDKTRADFGECALLFEPPSIDARIQNQFGLLSMMNGADLFFEDYLVRIDAACPGSVRRFLINSSAKAEIRSMLDQNNITERMLFPGLPGLSAWLKRYYSPA